MWFSRSKVFDVVVVVIYFGAMALIGWNVGREITNKHNANCVPRMERVK